MSLPPRGTREGWNHSRQGRNSCTWEPAGHNGLVLLGLMFPFYHWTIWYLTLMSSSLVSNCDTSTFSPSASLVRDTQSRPDARRWASAGSFSRRESRTTCSKLNPGWKTPRGCFLTFLARFNTSAQKWSERHHSKGHQLTWDLLSFSCWTKPGHASFYFLLLIAVVFLLSW